MVTPDAPLRITATNRDPDHDAPVVDGEEERAAPVPHRRVWGHFEGTDARFEICLPPAGAWEQRFHQHVYPLDDEHASEATIAFAASSGAYTVQTNSPGGYRIDAAAAKFAKVVAGAHYGSDAPIHGYLYGASGGGYQTIGAMENTEGVWDGAVPMVIGLPTSIPNDFFVKALARFVLDAKAEQIAEAVRPGGSGDPYTGLDDVERAVLREVTRMGVPLRAWEDHRYLLGHEDPDALLGFLPVVQATDPGYADDFWNLDGYLGTEQSALGDRFRAARTADDEWELAVLTYHRHQVPSRPGYRGFDQFRAPDGSPRHPQRPVELGPTISGAVCGTGAAPSHTGAISGKAILLQNLVDPDAFPLHGDWYRRQVEQSLGDRWEDSFRLWFNDHADHHAGPLAAGKEGRLVSYEGILQQALRDVSAWVERGEEPAPSTRYGVVDGQIGVVADAATRGGIQPVVTLTVDGGVLRADVQALAGSRVVTVEWDTLGTGRFEVEYLAEPTERLVQERPLDGDGPRTVVVRATTQRDPDADSRFTQVQGLGRVRVERSSLS